MHGGDIYNRKIEYDFSVNLNPYMPTENIKDAIAKSSNMIDNYPDYRCEELVTKLSNTLDVDRNFIVLTNGASEGIVTSIRAIKPDTGVIFEPAFSGYERALKALETPNICHISSYEDGDDNYSNGVCINSNLSVFFLASPSNPDGIQLAREEIKEIYSKVNQSNNYLILDECFINLSDDRNATMIEEIKKYPDYYDHLIVLRSFTKTFSIPGIRLGYVVSSNTVLLKKIKDNLPEWNISTPAMMAGIVCLDSQYKLDINNIKIEREYISSELRNLDIYVVPSNSVYILFKARDDLYELLLKKGILIRDCSDYYGLSKGYYRVAVKKHNDNEKLIHEIKSIYGVD